MAAVKPAGAASAGGKGAGRAGASAAGGSERIPTRASVASDLAHIKAHGTEHSAHGMGAKAFTEGSGVKVAGAGGQQTAAHEAAHVVQQRGPR